ncbi:hypothetical protein ACFV5N_03775, partial [Streptomyces sp. NPDC059853]
MRRALALLGAVLLLCVPATQAWAASYTYWSFWQLNAESGAWGYATQGPDGEQWVDQLAGATVGELRLVGAG